MLSKLLSNWSFTGKRQVPSLLASFKHFINIWRQNNVRERFEAKILRGKINQNLKENSGLNFPIIYAFKGSHLTSASYFQFFVTEMHGQAEMLDMS